MDCPTCEASVDAYCDGELPATESAEFERALEVCPECRRRLETARGLSSLLHELPHERAPDLLRARIERELRAMARPARAVLPGASMRWSAMAASLIVAVGVGWLGGDYASQRGRESDELVAAYMRVTGGEHPVDVESSDRHTVKPWFAGRIDYSPPVHDLTAAGFPLAGGRLDIVDGRKVSVLVYRHNQHRLAFALWPATTAGDSAPKIVLRDGFAMGEWRHGGFDMRAVSDVAPDEMAAFAKAMNRSVDTDK